MLKKCSFSVGVILLLTSAGFAAIGQTAGHTMVAFCHSAIVGHGPMAYSYYCYGAVGLHQQTCIVGCQYQVIHRFWWRQHEPQWNHPCKPPCESQSNPPCIVKGGDATATAVSYGGNVDPAAQAIGGDAILEINCGLPSNPSYIVKGGDATATATSYGGGAGAAAHATGGDAIVVIK